MHIGDILYRVNDEGKIEALTIIGICEELDNVNFEIDCIGSHHRKQLSLSLSYVKNSGKIFNSYADALKYKDYYIANFYDRILREALHCINLNEVLKNGKELKSSRIYNYPDKITTEATLYEYKEKLYVAVKEQDIYTNGTKYILFREVEKGINV